LFVASDVVDISSEKPEILFESRAFWGLNIEIVLPSRVMLAACDGFQKISQISMADGDSCHNFDRWREMRESGIDVDFRRLLRFGSGFDELKDFKSDVRRFGAESAVGVFDRVLSERYLRCEDDLKLVVKSMVR
jgi:hypothetical protein